jgi:hypothetical protein
MSTRFENGSLIGDLNDNISAQTSGSLVDYQLSDTNENETQYDLLPTIINKPPEIVTSILDASTPPIESSALADASGRYMYMFPDGTVKVNISANITLRIEAEQPHILNVENGILKIIPPKQGLTYVWRKDGLTVNSDQIEDLHSILTVSENAITFQNIQPEHAGTYTCEIINDIGSTISEPITLEILNPDVDSFFYRNLIKNPYGENGTDEWNSNNDDLTTKILSKTPSEEFMRPHRGDLFGYTVDMMHPRPYQIDSGVIRDLDMTKDLLKQNASYFTRTRYKYEKVGGSFLVRAYQDIDLADLEPVIKGSVYGISGVRAFFSCYIGNGISNYIPVRELVDPAKRQGILDYVQVRPRLSLENFLNSGPANSLDESVYVTIEEFSNETRLPSLLLNEDGTVRSQANRVLIRDPWSSRLGKYWGRKFYTQDRYQLGETSPGDVRDQILFVGTELYPDHERRYNYGQYIEFHKAIFERLNPNTNKVRITMNFETKDARIFDNWLEAHENTEEVREFTQYELPNQKHRFFKPVLKNSGDTIVNMIRNLPINKEKLLDKTIPAAEPPRGLVTALNFSLVPILTQQPETTKHFTVSTLKTNDTVASTVGTGLGAGRAYDPFNVLTKRWQLTFKHYSDTSPRLNNDYKIVTEDRIEVQIDVVEPNPRRPLEQQTKTIRRMQVDPLRFLPFRSGAPITTEAADLFTQEDLQEYKLLSGYIRYKYDPEYLDDRYNSEAVLVVKRKSAIKDITKGITPWTLSTTGGVLPAMGVQAIRNGYRYKKKMKDSGWRFDRRTGNWTKTLEMDTYPDLATKLNDYDWVLDANNQTRQPAEWDDVQSEWNRKVRYLLYYGLPGSQARQITLDEPLRPDNPSGIKAFPLQSYFLDIDFSEVQQPGDGRSKVTLSRVPQLFPGDGEMSSSLDHYIDPYGVLICTIPGSVVTNTSNNGGMQYPLHRDTGAITITDSPIKCIGAVHANIRDYTIEGIPTGSNRYANEKVTEVMQAVNTYGKELKRAWDGSIATRDYLNSKPVLPSPSGIRGWVSFLIARRRFERENQQRDQVARTNAELAAMRELVTGTNYLPTIIENSYTGSAANRRVEVYAETYNLFNQYTQSLMDYSIDKSREPNQKLYKFFESNIKSKLTVDLGNVTFHDNPLFRNAYQTEMPDHLKYMRGIQTPPAEQEKDNKVKKYIRKASRRYAKLPSAPSAKESVQPQVPSLLGVKPVDTELLGDGVGSPTTGIDRLGLGYIITYGAIQDTYSGTYRAAITNDPYDKIDINEDVLKEEPIQDTPEEQQAESIIDLLDQADTEEAALGG